jgi:hypothetical protein
MASYGENLIENGYRILPIMPGSKAPGRHQNGEWNLYPAWSRHCDRETKQFEIDMWSRWPGCAVGLACGTVIGIDIDVMETEVSLQLERLARTMLGDTPAMRIGQEPKRALYYRSDVPFSGRKRHPIEVYGRGTQMVIYAIHPITERPYHWVNGEGLNETDISKLPVITEAQAMAWLDAAYKIIPEHLKPATLNNSDRTSEWRGPSDPKGTHEAVKSALQYIPNDDVDGTSWVTMLNAIKAALGEEGRDLWLDWSKSSAKSGASGKTDTAERRWKSARPTSIGAGSIYYMAEQRGWTPGSELILNARTAENYDAPHQAAEMLAETDAALARRAHAVPLPAVPVSASLMSVGGVIGGLVNLCVRTAVSPQPFLALGAAITTVGVLAGRKYRTKTNLRTNLYTIGIADSGGGKDHARSLIKELLFAAGLKDYMGGGKIASGSGLLTSLERHPCRLFLLDEMGKFVGSVTGPKVASHREEIWTNLTELFTSASGVYLGSEYSDQKLRPRIDIVQPCCSVYGVTVPGPFWSALECGSMADGSLARFLIFLTDCDYPDRNKRPDPIEFPDELIASIQEIAAGVNPGDMPEQPNVAPDLYTVPTTVDADTLLDKLTDEQTDWLRSMSGSSGTAVMARYVENTIKVAMIRAISDCPTEPVIDEICVKWAEALVMHCSRTLLREAERFVSDNQTDANHKFVLDIIRKSGTIKHHELTKRTQKLRERERNEIINALVEGQQIQKITDKISGPGRPGATYVSLRQPEATGPITYH